MKIAVTARFQNSYFSGSIPQLACALARTLQIGGHDVTLIHPKSDPSWFIDVKPFADVAPPRKEWSSDMHYDVIIEVAWMLSTEDRARAAKNVIYFAHFPPIFHDTESCIYPWNPTQRNFKGISAIWTYDHFSNSDVKYLECLARVPVMQVPYLWDPDMLDAFVKEQNIPEWQESAKKLEDALVENTPPTMSWSARIVESNFSNSSHCIIPLNIVSLIRTRGDPIRFTVHNGEAAAKNEFFKSNIVNNLLLPDISGNMVPRVRLPDLRRDKSVFIAHQRFRPIKSFLLDATYLGIPMIHNCEMLKQVGAPYYYELNQIQQGADAWKTMQADYEAKRSFFGERVGQIRKSALRARFSPQALAAKYDSVINTPITALPEIVPIKKHLSNQVELRVAFAEMWDQFIPKYNFFMYLLAWVGSQNNIKVVYDDTILNVIKRSP